MSVRFAIALDAALVGYYFGYRQGFTDGRQAIHLWSNESVALGDWR